MAKAGIAVALLVTLVLAVTVSAHEKTITGRRLLDAIGSAKGNAKADGGQAFSVQEAQAGPIGNLGSYSVAAGASGAVSVKDPFHPSVSTANGNGLSLSLDGVSQSNARAASTNNGNPGTEASEDITVGSDNKGAATLAEAKAKSGTVG